MFTTRFFSFDTLTRPGNDTLLASKLMRTLLGVMPDPSEYNAEYRLQGSSIGTVAPDQDGFCCFSHRFTTPGIHEVSIRFSRRGRLVGQTMLTVACSDGARPAIIVDIDHTLTNTSLFYLMFMPNNLITPFTDAVAVLSELARRYDILYVTRREYLLLDKTRAWLALHGFPAGPVFLWHFWKDPFRAVKYKTRLIKKLKHEWPHIAIGIGDKKSDMRAYAANGLRAIHLAAVCKPLPNVECVPSWSVVRSLLL